MVLETAVHPERGQVAVLQEIVRAKYQGRGGGAV